MNGIINCYYCFIPYLALFLSRAFSILVALPINYLRLPPPPPKKKKPLSHTWDLPIVPPTVVTSAQSDDSSTD